MYKIIAKNLTFNPDTESVYWWDDYEQHKAEEFLFLNFHRYHGNHTLGHGTTEVKVLKVSRVDDFYIDKMIDDRNKEIARLQEKIKVYRKGITKLKAERKKGEYKEEMVEEFKMGRVPTRYELLKEGWEEEQIDNAFKEIEE